MATTQVRILAATLLALALSGCAKEPAVSQEEAGVIRATIPASLKTKVSMTESAGGGLALSWQNGDALRVMGETSELYSIRPGWSAHIAEFSGAPVSGTRFTVYYPGQSYTSLEALRERSYVSQTQNGNGSTAHLEWNALFEGVSDYSHLDFSQSKQNGVLYWRIELPDGAAAPRSVSLSCDQALFPQTNAETPAKSTQWSLSLSSVSVGADHLLHAWMMIPWTDVPLTEGTILNVSVRLADDTEYSRPWSVPAGGLVIRSGRVNVIKLYKSEDVDHLDAGLEGLDWKDLVPYVPPIPPGPGGDVSGSPESLGWNDLFPAVPTPPAPSGDDVSGSPESLGWNDLFPAVPTPPAPSGNDVNGATESLGWNDLFPAVPTPPAPSGNNVNGSQEGFTWNYIQFGVL